MLTITETMNSFLNLIRNKEEGGPFSRFKSWEYCHLKFKEYHDLGRELTDEEIDFLALHLSFYLASWGMYRGSSFILQRDYKTHREIVRRVFKSDYNDLWDYDPQNDDQRRLKQIAELAADAYQDISNAYLNEDNEIPERCFVDDGGDETIPVSITLVTKILMGTFAISPAYDRFFQDGIKLYKDHNPYRDSLESPFTEKSFVKSLVCLFQFIQRHHDELNIADGVTSFNYPMMKKVDMYFWEVGYEFGFYENLKKKLDTLNGKDNFDSFKSKKPLLKTISQIKILFPNCLGNQTTDSQKINHLISFFERRL